jgi:hypothetical protein
MVVVPASMPVSMPEPAVMVPIAGVLLDHVPPAGLPVRAVVEPSHTCIGPLMPVGKGFTTIVIDLVQPPTPWVMEVVPANRPVTTPVADTVPTAGLLLLQVPPGVELSVVDCPTQMLVAPVITAGNALTVNTADVRQPLGNV